jgi:hypothetical protein
MEKAFDILFGEGEFRGKRGLEQTSLALHFSP